MWLIKLIKELIKACFQPSQRSHYKSPVCSEGSRVIQTPRRFGTVFLLPLPRRHSAISANAWYECRCQVWIFEIVLPPVRWMKLVIHPGRNYKSQTGQTGCCFSDQVSSNTNTMIKDTDAPTYEWRARQAYWHMRFREPELQSASLYYHENPFQNGKQMLLHFFIWTNKTSFFMYPHMSLYIIRHLITLVALYLTPTQKTPA